MEKPTKHTYRWLTWVLFLLRAPDLRRPQWRVLLLIAAASVFNQYDLVILQLSLPQIRDALNIPDERLSGLVAIIKLGELLAFPLLIAADRLGRRQVLVFVVLGYTLLTGATALATGATTFVAFQFLAHAFITAELLLAAVIIAEEFPANVRGWGIGALLALSTVGGGLASVLFALIDVLPFGWRALFAAGLAPLIFIEPLRRTLPETERFRRHLAQRESRGSLVSTLRPVASLVRAYPGRFAAILSLIFLFNFAGAAAFFLNPIYLQEEHGWQPWHVSTLFIIAGSFGFFGSTLVGFLGDRIGRKRILILFGSILPLFIIGFYNADGFLLPFLWAGMAFSLLGVVVLMLALGTEIFPTSYRSTVSGARTVVAAVGTVFGLSVHGLMFTVTGSQWSAISMLALLMFLAPVVVAVALPEPSGRALEEIAPER